MLELLSLLGLVVILGLAWLLSIDRRAIRWRPVLVGTALQFGFALIILRTTPGQKFFAVLGDIVRAFLDFTDAGAIFVFGERFKDFYFAFKVLPTIIFFSSFITVLYYLGVLQWVVKLFARVMVRFMGTSGSESLSASANIFVGQTEAPLLIKPYVDSLTKSELMAVMTGGFATIAGGVMAAYVGMGISPEHLLAASVMSAPAALVMAKLMFPEKEHSVTAGKVEVEVERPWANVIDAAASGAADGLKLALNVGAMLIAFIGLIALVNAALQKGGALFGFEGLTLEWLIGWVGAPLAWVMGVDWSEAHRVGQLLGIKTVVNEFVGYVELQKMIEAGELSTRAQIIATYALCGFSNLSSIAIQIGGIGGIAPERKQDLARLGLRAMIAGSLACFQTATIAGILL
ncbi:MAG: NupC/NupG family nucleoside CNT transporter [Acidobacteria bacterium]|jgi:CNT family concentrative nucleoside transporter|nr:NupC/NupG family nucleoside CNT transporter [Thermoanaerobaculia bacterium]NLN11599.1 NupC/NupG family nucleoside CNT transporter [Acidobacteriota bacterium]OQC40642.1 MAG: Nucleoside permease NupX [Acidobacteria bacterium ADurb.Bin051]MBP7812732.1 NupC/NupG family nucleoside CNT transporter [Thermoanaerobaculia bacterium]MBP8844220.1 NupC/NupG family nucleoside CNT transporter [Thermoanaerobaculia bacterium]